MAKHLDNKNDPDHKKSSDNTDKINPNSSSSSSDSDSSSSDDSSTLPAEIEIHDVEPIRRSRKSRKTTREADTARGRSPARPREERRELDRRSRRDADYSEFSCISWRKDSGTVYIGRNFLDSQIDLSI